MYDIIDFFYNTLRQLFVVINSNWLLTILVFITLLNGCLNIFMKKDKGDNEK